MRISVGCDHRGIAVKKQIIEWLNQLGQEPIDEGTHSEECIDYPDIAAVIGRRVAHGEVDRGILVCSTGIGMAIAANKIPGIRAATCNNEVAAEMSRRHNDLNVLCVAADLIGHRNIQRVLEIWLSTEFDGGRHARRLEKIVALERDAAETK
jgi:ribose 5-phosphate isomerase B